MKKIISICLLLFATTLFSQDFTYNKVVSAAGSIKMKGSIRFTDSIIFMKGKGFDVKIPVKLTINTDLLKQYKVKVSKTAYSDDLRYSLTKDTSGKKIKYFFITEIKDDFSGTYNATTYFLKPIGGN